MIIILESSSMNTRVYIFDTLFIQNNLHKFIKNYSESMNCLVSVLLKNWQSPNIIDCFRFLPSAWKKRKLKMFLNPSILLTSP
jgi:hypothetical protein